MTGSGNGHLFRVDSSGHVRKHLKSLAAAATAAGRGPAFAAAFAALYDRLRKDPKNVGEALYRLPALKLTVYLGVVSPLAVHYAVHDDKPLVILKWAQDLLA
jgi:hypothetical protein